MTVVPLGSTISRARAAGLCALLFASVPIFDTFAAQTPPSPAAGAFSQAPRDPATGRRSGTAVVRGRVTRADNGQPLRNVRLELSPSAETSGAVFSDADGRFVFERLPAGRYGLNAYKGGYVAVQTGQPWAEGSQPPQFQLAEGQVIERVDLALVRTAVISGQVLDDRGEEVTGAFVRLMRQTWTEGYSYLESGARLPQDTSDDRGEFRLFDVAAGATSLASSSMTRAGRARSLRITQAPIPSLTLSRFSFVRVRNLVE